MRNISGSGCKKYRENISSILFCYVGREIVVDRECQYVGEFNEKILKLFVKIFEIIFQKLSI